MLGPRIVHIYGYSERHSSFRFLRLRVLICDDNHPEQVLWTKVKVKFKVIVVEPHLPIFIYIPSFDESQW